MMEVHKAKTTFSELSITEKKRTVKALAVYFKQERFSNKVIFSKIFFKCNCKVPGIRDNVFANWVH